MLLNEYEQKTLWLLINYRFVRRQKMNKQQLREAQVFLTSGPPVTFMDSDTFLSPSAVACALSRTALASPDKTETKRKGLQKR